MYLKEVTNSAQATDPVTLSLPFISFLPFDQIHKRNQKMS